MKSFVLWCTSIAVAIMMIVVAIPKATTVFAATGDLSGAAWSSNIGHIDLGHTGATYGVKMATTGTIRNLSGYAWSSNIGWVTFNTAEMGTCPGGAVCQPRVEWGASGGSAVLLKGFVRACSVFANSNPTANGCGGPTATDQALKTASELGGWDGFISLGDSKTDAVDYGVKLNTTTGNAYGYAWGSEVVGWVDFSGVKVDIGTLCPGGGTPPCPPPPPEMCADGVTPVSPGPCPNNNDNCPVGLHRNAANQCVKNNCSSGSHWNYTAGSCVRDNCPTGYHYDEAAQQCIQDVCPASPAEGSACWCAIPGNGGTVQCSTPPSICPNIPPGILQDILGASPGGVLPTPPYRKVLNSDGTTNKCLCVAGYVLNADFKCVKPVYTEH